MTTLVIASRLLLEFAIEAVIEDIKTKLKRDKAAKILICQKISKSIDNVRNTIGEVITCDGGLVASAGHDLT